MLGDATAVGDTVLGMAPALGREARIARERRKDPEAARVEYDAEFANDVTTFLVYAQLEAAMVRGRTELPPRSGVKYQAGRRARQARRYPGSGVRASARR